MARILVVDDEPHIVRLVSFSLEKRGHEVRTAPDALSGLAVVGEWRPDLILMDVMMPVMTGIEALEQLKAAEDTSDIPVVMLSAKSQHYEQEEGLSRGAEKYICKPFTPSALADEICDVLDESDS